MDPVLGVIEVEHDHLRRLGIGLDELIKQDLGHAVEFCARRPVLKARHRRLRGQRRAGLGQPSKGHLKDRVCAQGIRVIGIFVASGNLKDALA